MSEDTDALYGDAALALARLDVLSRVLDLCQLQGLPVPKCIDVYPPTAQEGPGLLVLMSFDEDRPRYIDEWAAALNLVGDVRWSEMYLHRGARARTYQIESKIREPHPMLGNHRPFWLRTIVTMTAEPEAIGRAAVPPGGGVWTSATEVGRA